MSDDIILVTGATGKLGRIITRQLLDEGHKVRVFTRRPETARELFGDRVEIAEGDFAAPEQVAAGVRGISGLVLLSPIDANLARDQIAVIDAAEAAGVRRIVKISGSDWTFGPDGTFSGKAHRQIEERLEAGRIPFVSLRPNAWIQVSLPAVVAQALERGALHAGQGEARVSYIDARDIAAVAVERLLAPSIDPGILVLTGGEALRTADLAATASDLLGRPIGLTDVPPDQAGRADHANDFEKKIIGQFLALLKAGKAEPITDTVPRLLGRPPRTVRAYLEEAFAAEKAA